MILLHIIKNKYKPIYTDRWKHSIAKNINILSLSDRYTVAKILLFRDCKLLQSNNGAYIQLKDWWNYIKWDIYFLKD